MVAELIGPQLGWIIVVVSSAISQIQNGYPKFGWWAAAYMFCVIAGVTVVVASASQDTYHVAVGIAKSV